jgi:hypothetical protein
MLMFQKFNFTNQKETITEEGLWAGTKPLFLDVTVEQYQLLVGGQESYRRVITVNFDYNYSLPAQSSTSSRMRGGKSKGEHTNQTIKVCIYLQEHILTFYDQQLLDKTNLELYNL